METTINILLLHRVLQGVNTFPITPKSITLIDNSIINSINDAKRKNCQALIVKSIYQQMADVCL